MTKHSVNMIMVSTVVFISLMVIISGSTFLLPKVRAQKQEATPQATSKPEIPAVDTGDQLRTVTVSGNGQVAATPDLAVIRLGVQTDAETAQEALSQNNDRMGALTDALKNAGIAAGDLQTQSLQLYPRYETQTSSQSASPKIIGYTVANTVEVRLRDLNEVGDILDEAVKAGGNTIESISFQVDDSGALLEQARADAMNDAKTKAQQLASLADAQLGPVLIINEASRVPVPVFQRGFEAAEAGGVPVEPGTEMVTVDLQVTWILAGGGGQ